MTRDVRAAEAFATMVAMSRQYPTMELHIAVQNGWIRFGIPNGPEGDRFAREWEQRAGAFSVPPVGAA